MDDEERRKQEYLEFKKQFERDFLVFYKGRMKRKDYLMIALLVGIPLAFALYFIDLETHFFLGLVLAVLGLYYSSSLHIKRLHDIGLTGWYIVPYYFLLNTKEIFQFLGYELTQQVLAVAFYCSLLSIVFGIVLIFCPSQKQDNKYGRFYPYSYIGRYKNSKA